MYIQLKYIIVVFKSWLIFLKLGGQDYAKIFKKNLERIKTKIGGQDYAKGKTMQRARLCKIL